MSDFCEPTRTLVEDLRRISAGHQPDAAALAPAPLLNDWYCMPRAGTTELALGGTVQGHSHLPDGCPIVTSPVMAIGITGRWVRTECRFYRLGPERTNV